MSIQELLQAIEHKKETHEEIREELVEWHRRFSLPFANVVFGLLAASLSIQPLWAPRSHGFATSLGVILCYYLLLTAGEALGKKGGLPPSLALWLPNLALGSAGFVLFFKTAKEKNFL